MASTSTGPTHGHSTVHHTAACIETPRMHNMEADGTSTATRDTPHRPMPGGALLSPEDADAKMRSVVRRNARLKGDFAAASRESEYDAAVAVPGAKRPHSAISRDDDNGDDNDDPVVTVRRQRVATDPQEADRLRSGLAGAASLGDLGLMIQAVVRLTSVYPADDVCALVAGAYPARRTPGRCADGDPAQGADGNKNQRAAASLWAPTAFVEWFAANHEAYGLANTPDYIWNTMVPPRSPSGDADRWSQAYWLANNNAEP